MGSARRTLPWAVAILTSVCVRPATAQWAITAADTLGTCGFRTHLALDAAGQPHIAFMRMEPYQLLYATRAAAGEWRVEIVDTATTPEAFYSAIALDSKGTPHIAYSTDSGHLGYATRDSVAGWQLSTVDADSLVGLTPSLAFDAGDRAVISYYDARHGDLKLAQQTLGGWSVATLDTTQNAGWDTSLALDARDLPHIAYHERDTGELRYLVLGGGSEVVDEPGPFPTLYNTSLRLDAAGEPHISYLGATHLDLRYAVRAGGAWTFATPDSSGETGGHTCLALDHSGLAHISYHDRTRGNLRYASQRADGSWNLETVDGQADSVGEMSSLALDGRDAPHISYLDKTYGNLAYAEGPEAVSVPRPSARADATRWSVAVRNGVAELIFVPPAAATEPLVVDALAVTGRRLARLWNGPPSPDGSLRLRWTPPRGCVAYVIAHRPGRGSWATRVFVP